MDKIHVIEFGFKHCPKCGGEMYLLESKYDAYELADSSTIVTRKVKTDALTELVCSECGFHVQAEHSIFGILPKGNSKLEQHERDISQQNLAKEIGYIE